MRILLAGDEDALAGIRNELRNTYTVDAFDGEDASPLILEFTDYDAIILYSKITNTNIYSLCSAIRKDNASVPIILLHSATQKINIIRFLNCGADLCLEKETTSLEKLNSYIRVFIRRNNNLSNSKTLNHGPLTLDLISRKVFINNVSIDLRKKEYALLEFLLLNRGKIISEEKILDHVWDRGVYVFSNTLAVHIRSIRNKIDQPNQKSLIKTIKGVGYTIET